MNVERAGTGDIDALVQMRLEYLREDNGGLEERDAEAIRAALPGYFRAHLNRDLFAYAIRDGGTVVSCAFLLVVEKPMSPAFPNGRTGIVLNVFTRPEHRRKGWAGIVMGTLLAEAQRMELSAVELKATDAGYSLYRSVGFQDDQNKYHPMKWMDR